LAEKYYSISPYVYCKSDPVNYIDHDGRFCTEWMAELSRDWYNLWHKTKASPVIYNVDAQKNNFKYTYQTGESVKGEVTITSHYKFDNKTAQTIQNVGDGAALAGYGLTLSVAGAEVGVPLAAVGNAISLLGSGWEFGVDLLNTDWGYSGKKAGFIVAGELAKIGLKKVLPGVGAKIGEKSFNLGTEILTQGVGLKLSGIERIVDSKLENDKVNNKVK